MPINKTKPQTVTKSAPRTITLPKALVPGAAKYGMSASEVAQLDNQIAAWRMRVAGKGIPEIAKAMHISVTHVRELLALTTEMLKAEFRDDIEGFKELELARTDRLIAAIEPDLEDDDHKYNAADMILKTMRTRATIAGLDKQRIEVSGSAASPIRVYHGADLSHILQTPTEDDKK